MGRANYQAGVARIKIVEKGSNEEQVKRRVGRPRRGQEQTFPAEKVDQLLVHGEVIVEQDGKPGQIVYPSYRELARRFDISPSAVGWYAKKHDCLRRRIEAEKQRGIKVDENMIELRAQQLTYGREDMVRTIDKYLLQFESALDAGRVRVDDPADYNTMLRLRDHILGAEAERREIFPGVTLEDLQQSHQEYLEQRELNPLLTGEVQVGSFGASQGSSEEGEGSGSETEAPEEEVRTIDSPKDSF